MSVFLSDSREATEAFAAGYAKTLSAGDVVLLDGEMGAGKTVFAKGVAKAVADSGLIGVFTGGVTGAAGGIAAAITFGCLFALIAKPKSKS